MAHELRCTWSVVAPQLAARSEEVRRTAVEKQARVSYTPPVFREPGDRLVVAVRSDEELDSARALMAEVNAAAIVVAEGAVR
jgi:hypothetical protein